MGIAKYSEKQILCGLQECWKSVMGNCESFDSDTKIDLYLKENGNGIWDMFYLRDLVYEMERFFHFTCSIREWDHLFGFDRSISSHEEWENLVGQHLTFGVLAQFIAERAPAVSFQPVTVMGSECRPAGVFFGLQSLTKKYNKRAFRFAPSTKIINVLRGLSLEQFWDELQWMTEHGVPVLPGSWRNIERWGYLFSSLIVFSMIPLALWGLHPVALVAMSVCALMGWLASSLYKNWVNPLPSGIRTFRDLAVLIANHDCDVVRNCEAMEHG